MNATAEICFLPSAQPKQLETRFDAEHGAYWAMMQPRPRACFNTQLLSELKAFIDGLVATGAHVIHKGDECSVGYAILASKLDGVFNLGGDLELFRSAIESGEFATYLSATQSIASTTCIPGTAIFTCR